MSFFFSSFCAQFIFVCPTNCADLTGEKSDPNDTRDDDTLCVLIVDAEGRLLCKIEFVPLGLTCFSIRVERMIMSLRLRLVCFV